MRLRNLSTAVIAASAILVAGVTVSKSVEKTGPKLAHMVFFGLKDHSKASRDAFVASCEKYLSGHEGVSYFSVGVIAEDVVEPNVSVRDFDVALHLVFENKEAEAKYLKAPRHVKFVEENREKFAGVRVFDTYIATDR